MLLNKCYRKFEKQHLYHLIVHGGGVSQVQDTKMTNEQKAAIDQIIIWTLENPIHKPNLFQPIW